MFLFWLRLRVLSRAAQAGVPVPQKSKTIMPRSQARAPAVHKSRWEQAGVPSVHKSRWSRGLAQPGAAVPQNGFGCSFWVLRVSAPPRWMFLFGCGGVSCPEQHRQECLCHKSQKPLKPRSQARAPAVHKSRWEQAGVPSVHKSRWSLGLAQPGAAVPQNGFGCSFWVFSAPPRLRGGCFVSFGFSPCLRASVIEVSFLVAAPCPVPSSTGRSACATKSSYPS
jgi:hypothetical protein